MDPANLTLGIATVVALGVAVAVGRKPVNPKATKNPQMGPTLDFQQYLKGTPLPGKAFDLFSWYGKPDASLTIADWQKILLYWQWVALSEGQDITVIGWPTDTLDDNVRAGIADFQGIARAQEMRGPSRTSSVVVNGALNAQTKAALLDRAKAYYRDETDAYALSHGGFELDLTPAQRTMLDAEYRRITSQFLGDELAASESAGIIAPRLA